MQRPIHRLALAATLLAAPLAIGQQRSDRPEMVVDHLNIDFYGIGQYTDNVYLTRDNEVGQFVLRPRVDIDFQRPGERVESSINGTFEGREYLGGEFGGDVVGNFAGRVNWRAIPGRLDWVFEDYLSTSGLSTLANDRPGEVQLANVFVTGPTLRARFQPRLSGQIDLRYARSDAQETDEFDGGRLAAAGRLMYLLTPTSKAGLNLATQDARYDTLSDVNDFQRRDAFVNFERTASNNRIAIEAGYTWLDFVGEGGKFAGNLLRATASYQFTPRASIAVQLARQYNDIASSMELTPTPIGQVVHESGLSRIAVSPDVYREQRASVELRYHGDRWDVRVEPFYRELDFLRPSDLAIDTELRGIDVAASYRLTPLWMLSGMLHLEDGEYPGLNAYDNRRWLSVLLTWQFARRWAWNFELTHRRRDSDLPNFTYRENIVGASLTYRRYERIQQ